MLEKVKKNKIHASPKLAKEYSKHLTEPNPYLETQKKHQDWYLANAMGKQRGKPRYDMAGKKIKKKPKT